MLGILLNTGKDKVAAKIEALGQMVISNNNVVAVRTTEERRASLIQEIDQFDLDKVGKSLDPTALAGRLRKRMCRQIRQGVCSRHRQRSPEPRALTLEARQRQPPALNYALQRWKAFLTFPTCTARALDEKCKDSLVFPDGYCDQDNAEGGAGFIIFRPGGVLQHAGAMIPHHLKDELQADGKKQCNTQAELLAVLAAILASADQVAGNTMLIADDSTSTVANILNGSSTSKESRKIVGTKWLLAAIMDIELVIAHVPGVLKPWEPFSRPEDESKQELARALADKYGSKIITIKWPPSLDTDPQGWAEATKSVLKKDSRETAYTAYVESFKRLRPTSTPQITMMVQATWPDKNSTLGYVWKEKSRKDASMRYACTCRNIVQALTRSVTSSFGRFPIEYITVHHHLSTPEPGDKNGVTLRMSDGEARWRLQPAMGKA